MTKDKLPTELTQQGMTSPTAESAKRDVQVLKNIKGNLENELSLAMNRIRFLQENIERATNEKKEALTKNAEIQKEIKKLEEALRAEKSKTKDQNLNEKSRISELEAQLSRQNTRYQQLQSEFEELQQELTKKLKAAENEKRNAQEELTESKQRASDQIQALKDEIHYLQELNRKSEQKFKALEGEYSSESRRVSDAVNMLSEKEDQLRQAEEEVYRLIDEKETLEKQLTFLKDEVISLRKEAQITLELKDQLDARHKVKHSFFFTLVSSYFRFLIL